MSSPMALLYASLLFRVAVAMPGGIEFLGPMPTPMGLMASAGISPRPTEAPGSNGTPLELRKRQNVRYPPPAHWCGFVEGDYDVPLSCSATLTCVNSLDAIGCCTATTGTCTNLYTTCANYGAACDLACQLDPAIRKCGILEPYCGTFRFPGGTYLYNCDVTSTLPYSVEFLNDYYVTAIGSTLASETTNPFPYIADVTQTAYTTSTSTSYPDTTSDDDNSGLSRAAINGIAAAGVIVGIAILAIIAFFCVRLRKRRRLAAASVPFANAQQQQPPPPSMQQQPQAPPPKAFEGYQAVPQQEQQVPQYTKYPSPSPQPQPQPQQQQQQPGYFPPPGPISPQSTGANSDPHFSTTNTTLLSPTSESGSQRQSYYKAPVSPTATEVDGTMGNPGVADNKGHGRPMEVDGTMGNPGVPNGGHGITNQGQPGGSPSAHEIDGRVGASMSKPFNAEGPYEMGHQG